MSLLDVDTLLTAAVRNATGLPSALPRPGQLRLAKDAAHALLETENGHVIGKAPTGVGKALAGLVPAALLAALHGGRTVMSTESLALQGQMVNKDFPAVAKAVEAETGIQLEIAVLKGWSNYSCRRAAMLRAIDVRSETLRRARPKMTVEQANASVSALVKLEVVAHPEDDKSTLFPDTPHNRAELAELGRATGNPLLSWALGAGGGDGDRAGYTESLREDEWESVSVSPDVCLRTKCPLVEMCFPMKARAKAAAANIVVTNHSVLAVQAAKGVPVVHGSKSLGSFDAAIVDEAHALPAAVRNAGAVEISGERIVSLVKALERFLPEWEFLGADHPYVVLLKSGRALADQVKERLTTSAKKAGGDGVHVADEVDPLEGLGESLTAWSDDAVSQVSEQVASSSSDRVQMQGRRTNARLKQFSTDVNAVRVSELGVARWYKVGRPGTREAGTSAVCLSPVDVSGMLAGQVWSTEPVLSDEEYAEMAAQGLLDENGKPPRKPVPVVALSATLPPAFGRDAGLRGRINAYESPFGPAYASSLAFIPSPRDAALPPLPLNRWGKLDTAAHAVWVAQVAPRLIEANAGHGLVLSTTATAGRLYAERLRAHARGRWTVLSQWDGRGKDYTTKAWREDPSSVLVGTRSYMTGVDAPGQTCSLVVVDRIPRDPRNVVDDARAELLAANADMREYVASETIYSGDAAQLLEQAVGRLIRSVSDRGLVAVLDPRLLKGNDLSYKEPSRSIYMAALDAFGAKSKSIEQACDYLLAQSATRSHRSAA